ncbi:sulfur oxidation c-type cytochrome SoxX [Oxalobacteraceae bacterium A2-2]
MRRFAMLLAAVLAPAWAAAQDGMEAPLAATPGDAARGRAIVADRQLGLCLLCHAAPIPEQPFQGSLGPDLRGAGARWTVAQLRLRVVDARRTNPDSIMPPYFSTTGLNRVANAYQGRTILDARQVEDVVAYLATLKEGPP